MRRSEHLCAGQSGQNARNGCQTKFKEIFACPRAPCQKRGTLITTGKLGAGAENWPFAAKQCIR